MEYHSPTISQITKSLAKAQGEMRDAKKDSVNPHFRSKYADLSSIIEACRKPLTSNGIAFTQLIGDDGNNLITMLLHADSGEWLKSVFPILCDKKSAQAIGSAITYAKRYSLAAICGIGSDDDDDDGNEASQPSRQNITQYRPPSPPPPPTAKADSDLSKIDGEKVLLQVKVSEALSFGALTEKESEELIAKIKTISSLAQSQKAKDFIEGRVVKHEAALKAEMGG
jgi:hypothetical protein